jgi:hypothetical protein
VEPVGAKLLGSMSTSTDPALLANLAAELLAPSGAVD